MATDEDSFVTVGSAFNVPEEDAPKKKALHLHEQFATDKEGRRRFHGAFTGGFSAGYFNTVGSKEGWTPSTFISSRAKRTESSRQKPEDFMDEDDLGDFGIAPRNVETTRLFSQEKDDSQRHLKESSKISKHSLDSVLMMSAFEDMVLPCRMSIGVRLLKKMGWKEGQGIGPRVRQVTKKKVYGCVLPSRADKIEDQSDIYADGLLFAPKDTKPITFVPKDNLHGIGYKGMLTASMPLNICKPGYSGNLKTKGQAFGVGAFEEEDEDVYTHDSMSNYDIEIHDRKASDSHLHGWTGPPSHLGKGGMLSTFAKASKPRAPNTVFPPPIIPREYQPFAVGNKTDGVKPSEKSGTVERTSVYLTSDERGKLLGEKALPKSTKSVFDYISKSDKDRIASTKSEKETSRVKDTTMAASSPLRLSPNFVGSTGFQPFAKDPVKQERYNYFLECRKSGKEVNMPKELCGNLTEWEREREKEEFSRSSIIFQPLKGRMAARFTAGGNIDDDLADRYQERTESTPESVKEKAAQKKMFGKLTRNTFEWHPAKLLCKRFNIPEPYPSSKTIGLVEQTASQKFSLGDLFNSSHEKQEVQRASTSVPAEPKITPKLALPEPIPKETYSGDTCKPRRETESNISETDVLLEASEQRTTEKPPMDLFKAIFASSSEESEDSQPEDEGEDLKGGVKPAAASMLCSPKKVSHFSDLMLLDDSAKEDKSNPMDGAVSTKNNENKSGDHNTEDALRNNEEEEYGPLPPPRTSPQLNNTRIIESKPFAAELFTESEPESTPKKAKKRKHKRRHKKKEKGIRNNQSDCVSQSGHLKHKIVEENCRKETVNDKEILSKLKSLQKKRMCAADFM